MPLALVIIIDDINLKALKGNFTSNVRTTNGEKYNFLDKISNFFFYNQQWGKFFNESGVTRCPNLPKKTLWWNLDSFGAKTMTENELIFSLDQLNSFFTSTQNRATSKRRVENNAGSDEFAFSNTFDLEVFKALRQIKCNREGWCAA
jgi:hypothetical protein